MTNKSRAGIVLLGLAQGLAGCGGSDSGSTPSAPPVFPHQLRRLRNRRRPLMLA